VLLLEVRGDLARADDGKAAQRAPTIATSSASYAKELHRWFPKAIRLPDPRRSSAVAVSPRNLCKSRELQIQHQDDTSIVVGNVAIGALPKGLRVADKSSAEYRVAAFGYVIPPKGGPIWAGEVTTPGRITASPAGMPSLRFSVAVRKLGRGASLLVIVVGEPIATRRGGSGGSVMLGSCVRGF